MTRLESPREPLSRLDDDDNVPGPADTDSEDEDEAPQDAIIEAMESLSLSSIRMQATNRLPFLLRTFRRGFASRCKLVGVSTKPDPPTTAVRVIYRRGEGCEYAAKMASWKCPICGFHTAFANRLVLGKHLEWDHQNVEVLWEDDGVCLLRTRSTQRS